MKKTNMVVLLASFTAITSFGAAAEGEAASAVAALGNLTTEAGTIVDAAWPLVTAVVVAGIVIKLFKKFSSKAS